MIGSLLGGVVGAVGGQASADIGSAFLGCFTFVFAAGWIAPTHRSKIGLAAASVVAILALGSLALYAFTAVEAFSHLSIVTPVAQCLGALYAVFILPPLVTPGTTVERLGREIVTLGTVVVLFGAVVASVGIVLGLLGREWLALRIGLATCLLGAVTWILPFGYMAFRVSKLRKAMLR